MGLLEYLPLDGFPFKKEIGCLQEKIYSDSYVSSRDGCLLHFGLRTNQDGNGWKWVLVAHNPVARGILYIFEMQNTLQSEIVLVSSPSQKRSLLFLTFIRV